jgi:hypothetical protein
LILEWLMDDYRTVLIWTQSPSSQQSSTILTVLGKNCIETLMFLIIQEEASTAQKLSV